MRQCHIQFIAFRHNVIKITNIDACKLEKIFLFPTFDLSLVRALQAIAKTKPNFDMPKNIMRI